MKTFFIVVAGLTAAFFAYAWYEGASELRKIALGLGVVILYVYYALAKQIDEAQRKNEARLDRIAAALHRQGESGLSEFQHQGLSELILDHQAAKRFDLDAP